MTLIKGTIARPVVLANTCGDGESARDYIGLVNNILGNNPELRIRPDSALYKAAVIQYYSFVPGTTVRPTLPEWFCGVDRTTNPLNPTIITTSPYDGAPIVKGQAKSVATTPTQTSDSAYAIDLCLIRGRPGSAPYRFCDDGITGDSSGIPVFDAFEEGTEGGTEGGTGSGTGSGTSSGNSGGGCGGKKSFCSKLLPGETSYSPAQQRAYNDAIAFKSDKQAQGCQTYISHHYTASSGDSICYDVTY